MPTAACGINCDVCKLKITGICSTCGPGISIEGSKKLEAQQRLLGNPCPILACAHMNHVSYCIADCRSFPCENFSAGPYPFSKGFLNMQTRRRSQNPPGKTPLGVDINIPPSYWDDLKSKNIKTICENALTFPHPAGLTFSFLAEDILVDIENRCICRMVKGNLEKSDNTLFNLIVLVYLLNVKPDTVANKMIGVKELKDAQFFQGPHELNTDKLLERFGSDIRGFQQAAEKLGGKPIELADAAYRLSPFPKIPLYYLLWEKDSEFDARISILFDRSIERHFSADAIWGLVNLVSHILHRS